MTANAWARQLAEDPLKASHRVWSTPREARHQGRITSPPPERHNASPHADQRPHLTARLDPPGEVETTSSARRECGAQVVEDAIQAVIGFQAASLLPAFGRPNPALRRG